MNIQLGIYEIFSTIIPGCIYLMAIGQVFSMLGFKQLTWDILKDLSGISIFIVLIAAYVLGLAFNRFGIGWYGLFKGSNKSVDSLNAFKLNQSNRWNINFEDKDWQILLALIRSKNLDLARETERHLASAIMLRNLSFGFLLLTIINLIQAALISSLGFLIASIVLFTISMLTISESKKFRRWYYDTILSTVLAYRIDLEKLIQPVEPAPKQRKSRIA